MRLQELPSHNVVVHQLFKDDSFAFLLSYIVNTATKEDSVKEPLSIYDTMKICGRHDC